MCPQFNSGRYHHSTGDICYSMGVILPEDIDITIIYEDEVLLVINKQSGVVVHTGTGNYNGTLLHAVKYHFKKGGMKGFPERMGLVHRLDKDTSGLLIIAKTNLALQHLTYQFFNRSVYRRYLALVWGNIEGEGTMIGNIGRRDNKRMEVRGNVGEGKHSVSHYKVLERLNNVTLVSCRIDTGRSHQIRTHFAHIGHPIFNDYCYGGIYYKTIKRGEEIIHCTLLQAQSVIFIHPITGRPMHFEVKLEKQKEILLTLLRRGNE